VSIFQFENYLCRQALPPANSYSDPKQVIYSDSSIVSNEQKEARGMKPWPRSVFSGATLRLEIHQVRNKNRFGIPDDHETFAAAVDAVFDNKISAWWHFPLCKQIVLCQLVAHSGQSTQPKKILLPNVI
jgi:hypothetical protein